MLENHPNAPQMKAHHGDASLVRKIQQMDRVHGKISLVHQYHQTIAGQERKQNVKTIEKAKSRPLPKPPKKSGP